MSRVARLGVFIVATLAILAVGLFLIGSRQFLFSRTYVLKAEFDDVFGLEQGAEVRVGGVHRGTIDRIDLPHSADGKVQVVMNLTAPTRGLVKKDSIASIETEGLLGDKYVAVSFGSVDAQPVRDGDVIDSRDPVDLSELIQKTNDVLERGQEAMENISQATSGLDDTMAEARAGATNFKENMEALKHNFFLKGFFKNRGYEDSSELGKYEVARMPRSRPVRSFAYPSRDLFDKPDTAKLKREKNLDSAGTFLAANRFDQAVVVARAGATGDSDKAVTLSKARALVVRQYLVEHFRFDDRKLRTLGLGKQEAAKTSDAEWGDIQVLIYGKAVPKPAGESAAVTRR